VARASQPAEAVPLPPIDVGDLVTVLAGGTSERLSDLMVKRVVAIPESATVLDACEFFVMHKFLAFPVVGGDGRMIGVVDVNLVTPEAFSLDDEPDALRDAYGRNQFGQGCLLARRLVERGVRFVQLYSGGGHLEDTWDGHTDCIANHKLHAGDLGMDCRYCHTAVDKSANASVPPTETCMNCHQQIWSDSPMLAPVRESWRTGCPSVRWTTAGAESMPGSGGIHG
jgi:hypothetical protein